MGRPSLKTPEIVEAICERLSTGEPLAQICRDDGMPAYRTVKDWIDSDSEVSAGIARARDSGEEFLAAECLAIANTPLSGEETEYDSAGNLVKRKVCDMLGHRKLQIETRLKLLAKWNPKKYGDAMTLKGDKDNPLSTRTDEQIKAEYAALMAKGEAEP